ncbi:AbfB domain-containing protein [Actinoplanes oblitus]|uniref:AbfB domain-containing protein n=1 Tax=Actinoplanes oblitus TaxID=3040509 RepID=A0ABY8W6S6_9ACTN|nr:AbfB domain-containing protein [Actinoplanes oblitus]WIM93536.1 AbfB domain-containing protein [Actinoplanes oblitus]
MTIYGPGGVDVRDRRRLHPGVLALVAVAGVIVVAAVGYFVFRSPSDPAAHLPAAASPPAAPATTTPAPSPSESPSPTAPAGVATGTWLVTLADDEDSYLVTDGEYAEMSDEPAPLTVVPGLADDTCVSFRNDSGAYLRHYDYRLRFDQRDDADLFRKDATFCPEDDQPAGTFRLRSKNYPDYFLHQRDDDSLYIDKPDGDADDFVEESSFSLRSPATP